MEQGLLSDLEHEVRIFRYPKAASIMKGVLFEPSPSQDKPRRITFTEKALQRCLRRAFLLGRDVILVTCACTEYNIAHCENVLMQIT